MRYPYPELVFARTRPEWRGRARGQIASQIRRLERISHHTHGNINNNNNNNNNNNTWDIEIMGNYMWETGSHEVTSALVGAGYN